LKSSTTVIPLASPVRDFVESIHVLDLKVLRDIINGIETRAMCDPELRRQQNCPAFNSSRRVIEKMADMLTGHLV